MNTETAAKLREPFPPEAIGKRPQPTCRACGDAQDRVCDRHNKDRCPECGQWMTTAHVHLDYVGHADVTDRFLAVDPDWDWEPLALTEAGLPRLDENGGLWIKLTVAGKTRLGYGDAQGKKGPNAVKEAIGDALRNAGMRFGVALDLWMKGERETAQRYTEGEPPAATEQPPNPTASEAEKARDEIRKLCDERGWNRATVAQGYANQYGGRSLRDETDPEPLTLFLRDLLLDAAKEDAERKQGAAA